MSKPDDIPQGVWDHAENIAKDATRDAMRDPLMPYYISVAPHIARALMAERHNACMILIGAPTPSSRSEIRDRIMRGDK